MSLVIPPLTRAQSARIRELLRDKRARNAEGAFIIEGAKPVYDALLHHPASVQSVVFTVEYERRESNPQRRLRGLRHISSFRCSSSIFSAMSDVDSPQGILALVTQPHWSEERVLAKPTIFGVYGEYLQDPANVGAIIRTAAGLGVDALWVTPESADVFNPKVVRASAGAVLSLPVLVAEDTASLADKGITLFAAVVQSGKAVNLESIRHIPQRVVVAVGNESRGLSAHTIKQAARQFTIPLSRHVESLNVAVTAAIALHYLRRLPVRS